MASLVIPTRDRRPLLVRALSSYTANAERHGHQLEVVIVDDSTTCDGIDDLPIDTSHTIRLLNREDRRRFAANAARHCGMDERILCFGLLGEHTAARTTGAARNAAILSTVGSAVVSVDDDTACNLWRRPTSDCAITPARTHPESVWFIDDRPPASPFVPGDADFIGAHEHLLGSTPRQHGAQRCGIPALDRLLETRVVATVAGSHGKPGMETAPHLLLDDESFARMASTETAYTNARQSARLLRVANGRRVTAGGMLMSTSVGLDNRSELPPFCPVERNQDGMYGILLQRVFAPALICHLPLAVEHDDGAPLRPWGDGVWRTIVPGRFCDLFLNALSFLVSDPAAASPPDRLTTIGEQIAAIRRLPLHAFREFVYQSLRIGAMHRHRFLVRRLDATPSAPPLLHDDLREAMRLLDAAAAKPSKYFTGVDDQLLSAWQRALADYGELMTVWQALRRFASSSPDAWRADPPQKIAGSACIETKGSGAFSKPKFECPFCGWRFARFLPHGHKHDVLARWHVIGGGPRPNAVCPMCFSMDRERLVYLYLRHHSRVLQLRGRLLHIAPERCLGRWLASLPFVHYIAGDLAAPRAACRMDITRLPLPHRSVDVVICNHVLEHVRDDAAALREIRRVLKPSGFAVIQVPIGQALKETLEHGTAGEREPEACEQSFGQADHVRIYGRDFPSRLERAGFECRLYNPVADLGLDTVRRFSLIEGERLHVVRPRRNRSGADSQLALSGGAEIRRS